MRNMQIPGLVQSNVPNIPRQLTTGMMSVKDNNYKRLSPTLAIILTVRARALSVVALEDVVVLRTGHVAAVPVSRHSSAMITTAMFNVRCVWDLLLTAIVVCKRFEHFSYLRNVCFYLKTRNMRRINDSITYCIAFFRIALIC